MQDWFGDRCGVRDEEAGGGEGGVGRAMGRRGRTEWEGGGQGKGGEVREGGGGWAPMRTTRSPRPAAPRRARTLSMATLEGEQISVRGGNSNPAGGGAPAGGPTR